MNFFKNLIWLNLRVKIRNLKENSIWYKTLFSLSKIFDNKMEIVEKLKKNIWLESATEDGLNAWGKRYRMIRLENESDETYKNRILFKRSLSKSGVSRKQKSIILEGLLLIPANSIRIENARDSSGFRIGDPIGTGIISQDYFVFSYTVFIDKELDSNQKIIAKEYIQNVNIGGNFPLFAELTPELTIFEIGGPIDAAIISTTLLGNKIYKYF